jgi:hypothetical protein
MTNEEKKLQVIVQKIVEQRREQIKVSPTWVATEAMLEIDPKRVSTALAYAGCHLHLRQAARSFLRDKFEGDEDQKMSHPLFPDLQARYPSARSKPGEEPEYVREENMTPEDYDYNITRMTREVLAKQKHVDALKARREQRYPSAAAV